MNTIIRLVFAVSMCVLLLAVAVIGSLFIDQTDGDVLRLLNAPGPVERWATLQIERNPNQDSPLIREARAYALLLDPPAPPVVAEPKVPVIKEPSPPVIQPQRSGPKFKVYATSVYTADSSRSMALIEEPGSGFRWIRPGDKVGHLLVDAINKESLCYRDGDRPGEIALEQHPMPNRLNTEPVTPESGYALDVTERAVHPSERITGSAAPRPARLSSPMRPVSPRRSRGP